MPKPHITRITRPSLMLLNIAARVEANRRALHPQPAAIKDKQS